MSNYLITGGTGSFGNQMTEFLLSDKKNNIYCLSRDEKKQEEMRNRHRSPNLKTIIGDVRDFRTCIQSTEGMDYVFHAAALKQVPSVELNAFEAVKTNIIGSQNLLEAATMNSVKTVVVLSTDKAVYPINAMGTSKAMMEKIAISKAKANIDAGKKTRICVTRYGNVMSSRGSVIPLFLDQIRSGKRLSVTNPDMTRFMMSLHESVQLVNFAFKNATGGEIFVQRSPASTIKTLIDALSIYFERGDIPFDLIGLRHGEKIHETLASSEEMAFAVERGDFVVIHPDLRDLLYSPTDLRSPLHSLPLPLSSDKAKNLSPEELLAKLIADSILE